ncbi:hypothetical protein F6Q10_16085 [Streptomyces vinaceus]|nr:hypothetical protein [Streptomyces vinaceus]
MKTNKAWNLANRGAPGRRPRTRAAPRGRRSRRPPLTPVLRRARPRGGPHGDAGPRGPRSPAGCRSRPRRAGASPPVRRAPPRPVWPT